MASTIASTVAGIGSQVAASSAANAASENQQNILDRKQENQRQALIENTKRLQANKTRQLAQLRVSQAASGFREGSGTALAIFGDVESRIDEEINENTNRALDALGSIANQKKNLQFGDKVRKSAGRINVVSTLIGGATKYGQGYGANYDRTGSDPFGIYKKKQP